LRRPFSDSLTFFFPFPRFPIWRISYGRNCSSFFSPTASFLLLLLSPARRADLSPLGRPGCRTEIFFQTLLTVPLFFFFSISPLPHALCFAFGEQSKPIAECPLPSRRPLDATAGRFCSPLLHAVGFKFEMFAQRLFHVRIPSFFPLPLPPTGPSPTPSLWPFPISSHGVWICNRALRCFSSFLNFSFFIFSGDPIFYLCLVTQEETTFRVLSFLFFCCPLRSFSVCPFFSLSMRLGVDLFSASDCQVPFHKLFPPTPASFLIL